ncbi:NmrA family NAD(P)-binding protein [Pedobacter sp. WC2501]|uniref:NmrA family NAD(P)-binding protein n=1 Tax=Pedobacter sp. WC2501 TaxID=3461400 RepID=UPI0040460B25
MKKIAIAAATGNIGSSVARQIASHGATALLLGQNLKRLDDLNINGGSSVVADISNMEEVIAATEGAEALFWLVPPVLTKPGLNEWYQKVTDAGIAAVNQNKIKRVVLVSSLGASSSPNLGTVSYCGEMEVAFDKLDASVLALRPGYFMENFMLQAKDISEKGIFTFPYDSEHDIPFVSTDDTAEVATRYLLDENWAGHWKLNLMGPENITLAQAASRLSARIGKSVKYVKQSGEEVKAQLSSWGLSERVQQELTDLFFALGDPNGVYATPRTIEASTSTTFEQFLERKLLPLL